MDFPPVAHLFYSLFPLPSAEFTCDSNTLFHITPIPKMAALYSIYTYDILGEGFDKAYELGYSLYGHF